MNASLLTTAAAVLVGAAFVNAQTAVTPARPNPIWESCEEMHDTYVEALLTNEPLATAHYRGVADSTGNAIDELEALVARADGKVN